jgi:hypothetical protein
VSNAPGAPVDRVDLATYARDVLDVRRPGPPIARTIGFYPVSFEAGRTVFELDTDLERHANPMGTLHGGILCDLADAAMGFAYASTTASSLWTPFAQPCATRSPWSKRFEPADAGSGSSAFVRRTREVQGE